MMELREKVRNRKGFTLVEMLIVVAIIAILVAVSIPMANTALEKARKATDDANIRAGKAVATIAYLDETYGDTGKWDHTEGTTVYTGYYDIESGTVVNEAGIKNITTTGQNKAKHSSGEADVDTTVQSDMVAATGVIKLTINLDEVDEEGCTALWITTPSSGT